jgi:hemolysin III
LREPFSSVSHFVGAGLGLAGLVALIWMAWSDGEALAAFSVYGATLVLLYLASAVYHARHTRLELLQRLDYLAIYALIVGTYTPICALVLRGTLGTAMLAAQIALAIAGIVAVLAFRCRPAWLHVTLYVVMGWMVVAAAPALLRAMSPFALAFLFAGGVVYTLGTVVYATGRPRLWPGRFGSHDLWHLFVLGGSVCHFVTMVLIAAR